MRGTTSALAPYLQIGLVVWRSLGITEARWLYVALGSCFFIMVVGGGVLLEAGATTFSSLRAMVLNLFVVGLQISWVFAITVLMRLNTPMASRTVPHYVPRLRHTALALWLSICLLTGLLRGNSLGEFCFLGFSSGVLMLLLSTPARWPVQWCVLMALLVYAGSHSHQIGEWAIVKSPGSGMAIAVAFYLGMAWLVTRLVATKGSLYATLLSRYLLMQSATPGTEAAPQLPSQTWGPLGDFLRRGEHWLQFPWRLYLRRALALPVTQAAHRPQSALVLARAALGFGPGLHWVMQAFAALALGAAMLLLTVAVPWIGGSGSTPISDGWAVVIALASLAIAVTPILALSETLRETAAEQKLMLLLPGMPQGVELNRLMAIRHLRQAFAAWLLAAVCAAALSYPAKGELMVESFYLGTLVLLPMVVQDWARVQAPDAIRALGWLITALVAPAIGLAAVLWLHVPHSAVATLAVVYCLIALTVRWSRMARFASPMPAGRLPRKGSVDNV